MAECQPNFKQPKQSKDIPAKTRAFVKARSKGMCEMKVEGICTGRGVQIDHIKNRSQGGGHDPSNLRYGCLACHRWKTEHPDAAEALGLYVRAGLGSLEFDRD